MCPNSFFLFQECDMMSKVCVLSEAFRSERCASKKVSRYRLFGWQDWCVCLSSETSVCVLCFHHPRPRNIPPGAYYYSQFSSVQSSIRFEPSLSQVPEQSVVTTTHMVCNTHQRMLEFCYILTFLFYVQKLLIEFWFFDFALSYSFFSYCDGKLIFLVTKY